MIGFRSKSLKRAKISRSAKTPLLPKSIQGFIARRITDVGGLGIAASGGLVLAALLTFHATDPSLNAATPKESADNALGIPGAYLSDILLQTLGPASALIGIVPVIWSCQILGRRPLGRISHKVVMLLGCVLAGSVAFARIPAPDSWPLGSYLGGSAGTLLLGALSSAVAPVMGGMAHVFIALSAGLVMLVALFFALGISLQGWGVAAAALFNISATTSSLSGTLVDRFRLWHNAHGGPIQARRAPALTERTSNAVTPREPAPVAEAAARRKPLVALRATDTKSDKEKEKARAARKQQQKFEFTQDEWKLPDLNLLAEAPAAKTKTDEALLQKNAELLQAVLNDFGVQGDIVKVSPGPIVTLYELEPAPGTKSSRVIGLADDIARSMSAVSVRVAVVPGRNAIGIELPNAKREKVFLREMLACPEYEQSQHKLALVLGKDIGGEPVIADLARMPHLLIAGTTGSGKSVGINTMILSLLFRLSPEKCRLIMIDPKMLELSVYDNIPHLLTPVVTEPHKAISSLKWAVREMENRYRSMSKLGVRNIEGYNVRICEAREKGEVLMHKVQTGFDPDTGKPVYEEQPIGQNELPYIVIIVDEFADLMLTAGKEVENAIQRLAQMARAAGIHLIMATQRPSVDVITGVIKANFPTRISFQVTSKIDSRTILGEGGAEQLLGQGDMLYMASGGRITRVHGPFVADSEVEKAVTFLKKQGTPEYIDGVTEDDEELALDGTNAGGSEGGDEMYDQAVALVVRERKASTSFIQRHFMIGYNRAARIIEQMEKQGVISEANHVGKREILVEDRG